MVSSSDSHKLQEKKSRSLHIGLYEKQRFEIELSSLTKHSIILGATGSGKTVLAKVIVEEAALQGIPTFAIDPKGDIGNLAFKSPTYDFSKWCGKEADALKVPRSEYARELSKSYIEKAKEYGLKPTAASEFAKVPVRIFTPKSSAGLPVGISPDLAAPDNFEQLVASDLSAAADLLDLTSYNILRLAGYDEDNRKEISFLSALLENSWKQGKSLTAHELIKEIKNPPISSIGSMHVSDVLSEKEKHNLATRINLLVSDPKLRSWTAAEPLDFSKIFGSSASVNVLDLRNIQSEQEKQLFVELVLQQLFQWLIKQGSAQTLRYLLYFDEIAGYCPPVKEPASKKLLLLLIKQARAFGLGMVLASQNAVDLDYKVISNANVRFIGRLGAQRDIQRVSVGLELDSFAEREIARLQAGEFFCNIFDPKFRGVIHSRWPITYHRGPLENSEISQLVAEFRNLQPHIDNQETKVSEDNADLKDEEMHEDFEEDSNHDQVLEPPTLERTLKLDPSSRHNFFLLENKFEPAEFASFARLSNIKSLKLLSFQPDEKYHPIFELRVSISEKSYSKQSLDKVIEMCALNGQLAELPPRLVVTPSRILPKDLILQATTKWNGEVAKRANIVKKELATKFDILMEEKRNENIKQRSEKPNSRIAAIDAKVAAIDAAITDDETLTKNLIKMYKEAKKDKTKSKSRLISLENKIESRKHKIQARLRESEQLKANRTELELQLRDIELDEKGRFHNALENIKTKVELEISGWLVETLYRAQILVNGNREHYGDVWWSSYTGSGTWGRCSTCSMPLEEGSACICGNLLCHNDVAYCKLCLEPTCNQHRASCAICNSIFCAAHSINCELCRANVCSGHGGVCTICSRKACTNCSKRKGLLKRELVCLDCSTK